MVALVTMICSVNPFSCTFQLFIFPPSICSIIITVNILEDTYLKIYDYFPNRFLKWSCGSKRHYNLEIPFNCWWCHLGNMHTSNMGDHQSTDRFWKTNSGNHRFPRPWGPWSDRSSLWSHATSRLLPAQSCIPVLETFVLEGQVSGDHVRIWHWLHCLPGPRYSCKMGLTSARGV